MAAPEQKRRKVKNDRQSTKLEAKLNPSWDEKEKYLDKMALERFNG